MDSITELNDLLGNEGQSLSHISKSFSSLRSKNVCEERRENVAVNKKQLKNIMHEWTPVIESQIEGNSKNKREVEFVKSSEKSLWAENKQYLSKNGDLGSDIMRLLYSHAKPTKETSEDQFVDEIARLQSERSSRLQHEQMMAKNRMGRKIKSKNFHRHAKRRDIKEYLKGEETNRTSNPDLFRDQLERFEKLRAQERISLKHKTGGKFARIQKLRAKYDTNARDALNDMHQKGQALTARNDCGDSDEDGSVEEEEEDLGEDEGVESDTENGDVTTAGGESALMGNSTSHRGKTFAQRTGSIATAGSAPEKVVSVISTSQSKFLQYDNGDADDADMVASDESRFKQAIYQVYQEDSELAAEFEREKVVLVDSEKPEDIQLFQPGWGMWTGEGFEAADKRRRERGLIKAPEDASRKDKRKTRVWIRQGVHDGLKKHLVKSIPFPYNTAEQYNLSRSELVSGVFNLQTVHRQLLRPRFVNKAGQPIYPLAPQEKRA